MKYTYKFVGNCCALLNSWAFNDIKSDNKNFGSCHGHYSIMSCFTNSWYVKIRTFNLTRTFGTGKKIRILYLILYWVCNYVEVYLCRECIRQKITAIFNQYSTLMLLFLVFLPLRINSWIQFSYFIQRNSFCFFLMKTLNPRLSSLARNRWN